MGQSKLNGLDELRSLIPHVPYRAINREPFKIVNNPAVRHHVFPKAQQLPRITLQEKLVAIHRL